MSIVRVSSGLREIQAGVGFESGEVKIIKERTFELSVVTVSSFNLYNSGLASIDVEEINEPKETRPNAAKNRVTTFYIFRTEFRFTISSVPCTDSNAFYSLSVSIEPQSDRRLVPKILLHFCCCASPS